MYLKIDEIFAQNSIKYHKLLSKSSHSLCGIKTSSTHHPIMAQALEWKLPLVKNTVNVLAPQETMHRKFSFQGSYFSHFLQKRNRNTNKRIFVFVIKRIAIRRFVKIIVLFDVG